MQIQDFLTQTPADMSQIHLPCLCIDLTQQHGGGAVVTQSCLTLAIWIWTVARQAPLPMGFSRQEYWSGLPFPAPGDLPDPGIKAESPAWLADDLRTEV